MFGTAILPVTSLAPVPVKVGAETVPLGVPLTDTLPSAPVKVGCVKALTLVATVVFAPFVGNVPALNDPADHPRVRFSFDTVAVMLGKVHVGNVPTAVIEFTVVVFNVTAPPVLVPAGVNLPVDVVAEPVKVGCDTVPAGVYVAVPEAAALTVAVLFVVAFVETLTVPDGVNLPVDVVELPVNVGCETVPAGV